MIVLTFLGVLIVWEVSCVISYGVYFNTDYDLNGFLINPFSCRMLSNTQRDVYIAIISPLGCLIGKFYISDFGIVPRWTKLHKKIQQKFNELENEKNNTNAMVD